MRRSASVLSVCLYLACSAAWGQAPQTGYPPYASIQSGGFDNVNLQNLNVSSTVPVAAFSGRGQDVGYEISFNSSVWRREFIGYGYGWYPDQWWGWRADAGFGELLYDIETEICEDTQEEGYYLSNFRYAKNDGTVHPFAVNYYDPPDFCNYFSGPTEGLASDGSGYYLDGLAYKVWTPPGVIATERKDTNGNGIGSGWDGTGTIIVDTVGRVAFRDLPPEN